MGAIIIRNILWCFGWLVKRNIIMEFSYGYCNAGIHILFLTGVILNTDRIPYEYFIFIKRDAC